MGLTTQKSKIRYSKDRTQKKKDIEGLLRNFLHKARVEMAVEVFKAMVRLEYEYEAVTIADIESSCNVPEFHVRRILRDFERMGLVKGSGKRLKYHTYQLTINDCATNLGKLSSILRSEYKRYHLEYKNE